MSRLYVVGVVVGCFLATSATAVVTTSFGVFHVAIAEDLAWNRAQVAGVFSLASLVVGFASPLVGTLVDRLHAGWVMVLGGVASALGLLLATQTHELWHYYASYGLLAGFGTACLSSVPQNVLLAETFSARRGAAYGLAAAGAGIGTFLLVPLAQALIASEGWRVAYGALAAFTLVVGLLPILVVRRSARAPRPRVPEAAAAPTASAPATGAWQPVRVGGRQPVRVGGWRRVRAAFDLVGHLPIALLVVAVFCSGVQRTIMVVHFVPHLLAVGYAASFAVAAFASADLVRSFSGTATGYLCDRAGARLGYIVSCGVAASAILVLTFPVALGPLGVLALALAYGLGSGGLLPASSSVQASIYRPQDRGKLFGITSMAYGLGSGAGAWLGAFLFDTLGDYSPGLWVAALALGVMSTAVWQATSRHQRLQVAAAQ